MGSLPPPPAILAGSVVTKLAGATGYKGHSEEKGNLLCWPRLVFLMDATAQQELEGESHHMLQAPSRVRVPPEVTPHSQAGGQGAGLSPGQTAHCLCPLPLSPAQIKVNKNGAFLERGKLANTISSAFITWTGGFQS